MKKRKLVRINTRMYEQNKYLASRVGELGRERDALRRELAALRTGCNGAIERNVQLVAEFNALEQAHEALCAKSKQQYQTVLDARAELQRIENMVLDTRIMLEDIT